MAYARYDSTAPNPPVQAIGMVAGDVIMGITASGVTFHRVTTVGSTYVTCTAGLLVSSAS